MYRQPKSTKESQKMARPIKNEALISYVTMAMSKSDREMLDKLSTESQLGRSGVLREAFREYVASRQQVAA